MRIDHKFDLHSTLLQHNKKSLYALAAQFFIDKIQLLCTMESIIKKINPLEVVQEQYQNLKGKLRSTRDVREKNVLFKRLINLAGVMQFLISISKNT
jgi:hypothetical protein